MKVIGQPHALAALTPEELLRCPLNGRVGEPELAWVIWLED
jgi:hypothetical protein